MAGELELGEGLLGARFRGSPPVTQSDKQECAGVSAHDPVAAVESGSRSAGSVAVVVLCQVAPWARLWGYWRFVVQRRRLLGVPGLRFVKMLGSGQAGGFGLRPSRTHQGLFLGFEDEASARQFVDHSPTLGDYRAHARELCVAMLRATSSKGRWSGASFETTAMAPADGPIAALTRASIRPRRALAFWRMAPAAETALSSVPGCLLAVGLGEAPLLRQATFSVWSSVSDMDAYARSGAHLDAIRASYRNGFFSESMFVRFVVLQLRGVWKGVRYGA